MVTPKLRGRSLNQIGDFFLHCKEAGGNTLLRINPGQTRRTARIANALYSHINHYVAPSDLKGDNKVIDIRPYSERDPDVFDSHRFPRQFDREKVENTFSVEYLNGVKTLRINKEVGPVATLATLDSLTAGQTVTGSGDVTDLTTNSFDQLVGNACVEFGLNGSTGSGTIKIALPSVIDISDLSGLAAIFAAMKFQAAGRLTNVQIRWGSDDSNYYYSNITSPHDRDRFESMVWSILRADWSSASTQGSPDATSIDTITFVFTYNTTGGAIPNNRLDSVTVSKGEPYEIVYYSNCLFQGTDGTYKQIPTADNDVVLIDGEGVNIFVYELMLILIQELGDKSVRQSARWFENQLFGHERSGGEWKRGLYDIFNREYPDQSVEQTVQYYKF